VAVLWADGQQGTQHHEVLYKNGDGEDVGQDGWKVQVGRYLQAVLKRFR